jgi:outer membrane lipoprotein SlyB
LAIAEQAPNLATSLGGARLGAMAGTALGPAGTVAGGIAGGLAGAFLPSLIQQYGGNIQRQAEAHRSRFRREDEQAGYGESTFGQGLQGFG